ncbi:hypothetical protein OG607_36040 [Streptomyces sp. NBC_01537]|uniref:hypothetical protein n=1 Tax=Streptomyces sp. NBC_01537 TaxID=2903896 RepID=UPI0038680C3B
MSIDWAALGSVFGVSLAVTVGLVGLFSLGIVGLAKEGATVARTGAYAAFALCAAAVAYGIFLIVS